MPRQNSAAVCGPAVISFYWSTPVRVDIRGPSKPDQLEFSILGIRIGDLPDVAREKAKQLKYTVSGDALEWGNHRWEVRWTTGGDGRIRSLTMIDNNYELRVEPLTPF